ncbi:hypothetical protein ACI8AG_06015 [Blastococcus sp. SYSU DS0552]
MAVDYAVTTAQRLQRPVALASRSHDEGQNTGVEESWRAAVATSKRKANLEYGDGGILILLLDDAYASRSLVAEAADWWRRHPDRTLLVVSNGRPHPDDKLPGMRLLQLSGPARAIPIALLVRATRPSLDDSTWKRIESRVGRLIRELPPTPIHIFSNPLLATDIRWHMDTAVRELKATHPVLWLACAGAIVAAFLDIASPQPSGQAIGYAGLALALGLGPAIAQLAFSSLTWSLPYRPLSHRSALIGGASMVALGVFVTGLDNVGLVVLLATWIAVIARCGRVGHVWRNLSAQPVALTIGATVTWVWMYGVDTDISAIVAGTFSFALAANPHWIPFAPVGFVLITLLAFTGDFSVSGVVEEFSPPLTEQPVLYVVACTSLVAATFSAVLLVSCRPTDTRRVHAAGVQVVTLAITALTLLPLLDNIVNRLSLSGRGPWESFAFAAFVTISGVYVSSRSDQTSWPQSYAATPLLTMVVVGTSTIHGSTPPLSVMGAALIVVLVFMRSEGASESLRPSCSELGRLRRDLSAKLAPIVTAITLPWVLILGYAIGYGLVDVARSAIRLGESSFSSTAFNSTTVFGYAFAGAVERGTSQATADLLRTSALALILATSAGAIAGWREARPNHRHGRLSLRIMRPPVLAGVTLVVASLMQDGDGSYGIYPSTRAILVTTATVLIFGVLLHAARKRFADAAQDNLTVTLAVWLVLTGSLLGLAAIVALLTLGRPQDFLRRGLGDSDWRDWAMGTAVAGTLLTASAVLAGVESAAILGIAASPAILLIFLAKRGSDADPVSTSVRRVEAVRRLFLVAAVLPITLATILSLPFLGDTSSVGLLAVAVGVPMLFGRIAMVWFDLAPQTLARQLGFDARRDTWGGFARTLQLIRNLERGGHVRLQGIMIRPTSPAPTEVSQGRLRRPNS